MEKPIAIFKTLSSRLVIRYNGHVYLVSNDATDKDLGRLFEALLKNTAKLNLKLSSKKSKPQTILLLTHIQGVLEMESAAVTRVVYIRIMALAKFLELYSDGNPHLCPSEYLQSVQKDLFQIHQMPKLKPISRRLRDLSQLMETDNVAKDFVTEVILNIMKDLVHSVSR